ncbi:MAG: TonB-dependent receptor [Candidatus Cloacimonadota bacterium]|nr:TonB-dependent receptor [Candidatus Cloacimonadota bacterium]
MKKVLLALVVSSLLLTSFAIAQDFGKVAGRIVKESNGIPLQDVNVYLSGTEFGSLSNAKGQFIINNVPSGKYTLIVSLLSYEQNRKEITVTSGLTTTVNFEMIGKDIGVAGIEVVADRAKLNTPVAFSDVDKAEISESLGSRDIPLVLTNTPSVYSTCQGGGAGDARVNIRGFNQRNVAVMINGVPINDMENGWVYWSNWDGLGDATSSIQVQRGLSAVNLAVPSIGGTMNMITDATKMSKGVEFKQEYGTAGFEKKTVIANSGLVNDKYAFSLNVNQKTGNGIIDKTWTDAWSYYLATSYNLNENNRLEFYAVGAPQRHGQNLYKQNMAAYDHKYAKDHAGIPDSVIADYLDDIHESEAGRFYNENWYVVSPTYDGKQWWNGALHDRYSPDFLNERENFYFKPQINLNWFTQLSKKLDIYSVLYYSGGEGGGTGTYGSVLWNYNVGISSPSRFVAWDATIARNDTSSTGALGILRNSRNNQWTIGAISKLRYDINDQIKTSFGLDWRTAEIDHFREVRDLLGGEYYTYTGNDFDSTETDYQKHLGDKIAYYNTNTVDWIGGSAQGEYSLDKLNIYGMGGYSSIKYSYKDHFVDDGTGNKLTSNTDWLPGYQVKGGSSYRLTNNIGIFGNAGYVSKCPIFDEVINDYDGTVADDPSNEKFTDIEGGLNFVGLDGLLNIKGDYYFTIWNDQTKTKGITDSLGNEGIIFLRGMDSRHSGFEFELHTHPIPLIKLDASFSKGDWIYTNDFTATYKNWVDTLEVMDTLSCYVNDLKVGDAPQTQLALGATLYPVQGLRINFAYKYFCDFYASWDPFSRQDENDTMQSWEIPSYSLVDLHLFYKLPTVIKGLEIEAFTHIFNLFDEVFVQDATDNSHYNAYDTSLYPHTGSAAEVFFGLPRRFNAGISIKM